MRLLETKIEEAKDILIERFNWICKQPMESAKFMYENGTMAGYDPKEGIVSALKHGTLTIGLLGMNECAHALIDSDHYTGLGKELTDKVVSLYTAKCKEYKESLRLNFAVYYTPAENLCHTALKNFRKKYGVIPGVSDRDYFTNSIHVPVWKEMSPFEKIDIESQWANKGTGGTITYVELPSTTKNNIEALEVLVNYAMDKDIPYFAINLPIDCCEACGYQDEIGETCPKCGSDDITRLRRVTGYLTGDYKTAFNNGKVQETDQRVKNIKN
jgi:ribonucleoside-triphosphate reductase